MSKYMKIYQKNRNFMKKMSKYMKICQKNRILKIPIFVYQFGSILLTVQFFFMEIPSELFGIMKILENDPF